MFDKNILVIKHIKKDFCIYNHFRRLFAD